MSESSNSGVLSRALLLPLRRISLISSSSEVGSFAMIPAKENTLSRNMLGESMLRLLRVHNLPFSHWRVCMKLKSIQKYISKGPFRISIKTQSYHWYRAYRVGGSSPWLLSPFSGSPTARENSQKQEWDSFYSVNACFHSVKASRPVTWDHIVAKKAPILKVILTPPRAVPCPPPPTTPQLGPKVKPSTVKNGKLRNLGKFLRPGFSLTNLPPVL